MPKALKAAQALSKKEGLAFVVWVFDEGRQIFNAAQMKQYAPFCQVEATFMNGVQVASEKAVAA